MLIAVCGQCYFLFRAMRFFRSGEGRGGVLIRCRIYVPFQAVDGFEKALKINEDDDDDYVCILTSILWSVSVKISRLQLYRVANDSFSCVQSSIDVTHRDSLSGSGMFGCSGILESHTPPLQSPSH